MRKIARFVVDTHCHITTLYQPATKEGWDMVEREEWNGLNEEIAPYDNAHLTMYDMDTYGVDMAILLPSIPGTLNGTQAKLVKRFPDKFRACCSDQMTILKAVRGEEPWTFKAALEEVEGALKTGNFVGIGEFTPGSFARSAKIPGGEKQISFDERVDEWSALCELAIKYDVPLLNHDGFIFDKPWEMIDLLEKMSGMYPDAKIIHCHGCVDDEVDRGIEAVKDMYEVVGTLDNVYMETGGWCEKTFEVAFEAGVTANQLMWGHDYGNVPQYIVRQNIEKFGPKLKCFEYRKTASLMAFGYKDFPAVPTYQSDWYGWGMRTIDRVGDWLTQDEINLIMGGTAAKLYKLPVPFPRMFPEGRPDIYGDKWEESIPFLPMEQIKHQENVRLSTKPFDPTKGKKVHYSAEDPE
jgi:hypothetical protein